MDRYITSNLYYLLDTQSYSVIYGMVSPNDSNLSFYWFSMEHVWTCSYYHFIN